MKNIRNTTFLTAIAALAAAMVNMGVALADTKEAQPAATQEKGMGGGVAGNYLSGQFARSSGDIDSAIRYLKQVHASQPDNADVSAQLMGMLLLEGDIDGAIKLTDTKHAQESHEQLTELLAALREIKNDKFDAAADKLEPSFEGGTGQLWLPLLTAWLDLARHKQAKALTLKGLGIEAGAAAPLLNYHLALVNAQAGFKEAAAENFRRAIDDPVNPPDRVMQQALKFYNAANHPKALTTTVKAYLKAHPDGDNSANVSEVATPRDGVAEVLYTMGGIMLGAGVTNDAVIYLQLALYVRPDFTEAALALGDAYSDLQQFSRSSDTYRKVAATSGFYPRAQMRIAINEDRMGKLNDALALLDKVAKASPNDPESLVTKGDLLRIHSRYTDAAQAYTDALARIPDLQSFHWPVLFARGSCYERDNKWDLARADLKKALELKPDQPDVLNYLGFGMLEHKENLPEARMMIEKAVKARPNDAQIIDSMGWALYLQGDYKRATPYLEKAVELMPSDPTVNDHLGDVYWRMGRKTEARFQWERSLTFSPEATAADLIHRKLKDGLPVTALIEPETTVSQASSKPAAGPVTP